MKQLQFIILVISLFAFNALFSQKMWEQSSISPSFEKTKNYKIAVLPIATNDNDLLSDNALMNLAGNKIISELTGITNFQLVNKEKVKLACNKYAFGGSGANVTNYNDIARETGADVLVLCELMREDVKGIKTVVAFIQFFDVKNDALALYTGKARILKQLGTSMETEYAIQTALKKLTKAFK